MPKTKYGALWPDEMDDLQIEMAAIRRGGQWVNKSGAPCGKGLAFHYEAMRKILWPELDGDHNGQRWHGLTRDQIVANKITVLMGCGSSGKTHSASWLYLCEWLCNPEETCVLVSSTDIRGLRLRVWGEITSLWERAVNRFDYLPGHLVDSKLAISATKIDTEGGVDDRAVRDLRQAIIGIPTIQSGKFIGLSKFVGIKQKHIRLIADEAQCHVAGTLVDTPSGVIPIEALKVGDEVFNCTGNDRVIALHKRHTNKLVRISLCDGRVLIVTPEHPFFTQKGWIKACHLNQSHFMVGTHDSVQILRQNISAILAPIPLPAVPGKGTAKELQTMRNANSFTPSNRQQKILQSILQFEMATHPTRVPVKILHKGEESKDSTFQSQNIQKRSGQVSGDDHQTTRHNDPLHGVFERIPTIGTKATDEQNLESDGPQTASAWRQRNGTNKSRKNVEANNSAASILRGCENRNALRFGVSDGLQIRFRDSIASIRSRGGWKLAWNARKENAGCQEDGFSCGAWVDNCSLLKPEDLDRYRDSEGRITVYNLEVANHPSYSVNGLLCHNCMGSSFLSAFSNLNKNEDFRAVVLGNPNDILDPLGRAAEPQDGWDSHLKPEKTSVWKTRFMNGVCVNLVGTDSPNNDFETPRFKYLISKEKIDETVAFFGKDSFEYYSQCLGVMQIGTLARRVLTRRICEQGQATSRDVVWRDGNRTRIYFVDAAYGGDRCVAGHGEFGVAMDGKTILLLHEPKIIPIAVGGDKEPEQQIAEFVKGECLSLGIPPQNMGHDATGRGSLGTFLARVWSAMTNPIESGGPPTERPVCADIFINDPKTGARRLKTCKEHYIKLVTEFFFSVRYTVEASQLRGLTEETMEEFCMRQWDLGTNDRRIIESKQDMKERVGRSPDLADWAAGIVEMARRRGFVISKLANETQQTNSTQSFLEELSRRTAQMHRDKELNYAL